jgi:D-alanyl-D-alanine endopeptidase (penicillin-binding protein 7)
MYLPQQAMLKRLLMAVAIIAAPAQAEVAIGVFDYQTHTYIVEHNHQNKQPIASITKLFTAATILRQGQPLDELLKIKQTSRYLKRGEQYTRRELLKLMLIASDNVAADTLAHNYPNGYKQFLQDTNQWIQGFGLLNTTITDASGLLSTNQSTVEDLIKVLPNLQTHPLIQHSADPKLQLKNKTITNTNPHTKTHNLTISKTGTTQAAGKCVVMLHREQAIILLGHKDSQQRYKAAKEHLPQ